MSGIKRLLIVLLGIVLLLPGCREEPKNPVSPTVWNSMPTYQPQSTPKGLVLVLSDQAGWTPALATLGRKLAMLDYLVVGVDSPVYLQQLQDVTQACIPMDLALDALSQDLQQRHGIGRQKLPILVGIGQGAAMAYTAAAKGSAPRFHAVVSLNFCPVLSVAKPLCDTQPPAEATHATRALIPRQQLSAPWFVFQDRHNQRCTLDTVTAFVHHVNDARLVTTPADISTDQPAQAGQQQQFLTLMQWFDPSISQQSQSSTVLSGLPLIEKPAANGNDDLAVLLTGDGGWAAIDQGIAAELVRRRISTVGWDTLTYFWKPHPPNQAATDMARVLTHYLDAWHKQRIILIGYSFGANVLPFVVNRLPAALRARVDVIALLGLSAYATFEFHLTQWLGASTAKTYLVAPEFSTLSDLKVLCVVGKNETDSLCPDLQSPVTVRQVPGDHHFNRDYARLVSNILSVLPPTPTR